MDFDLNKGAVAKSILNKAGPEIQAELNDLRRATTPDYGDVLVTKGYQMTPSYVFHGSLKSWKNGQVDAEKVRLNAHFFRVSIYKQSQDQSC